MPECFGSSLLVRQVHNLTAEVSNSYEFLFYGVASKKNRQQSMYTHSHTGIYDEVSLRSLASS